MGQWDLMLSAKSVFHRASHLPQPKSVPPLPFSLPFLSSFFLTPLFVFRRTTERSLTQLNQTFWTSARTRPGSATLVVIGTPWRLLPLAPSRDPPAAMARRSAEPSHL